jgi:hypothetical protein
MRWVDLVPEDGPDDDDVEYEFTDIPLPAGCLPDADARRIVCTACVRACCMLEENICARREANPGLDVRAVLATALQEIDVEHPAYYSIAMLYGLGLIGGSPTEDDTIAANAGGHKCDRT